MPEQSQGHLIVRQRCNGIEQSSGLRDALQGVSFNMVSRAQAGTQEVKVPGHTVVAVGRQDQVIGQASNQAGAVGSPNSNDFALG